MSMVSNLKRFGIDAHREVAADGQISFTIGESATTSLKSHTFHGGIEAEEGASSEHWWHDEVLLQGERDAMAAAFPAFTELLSEDDMPPVWYGTVNTGAGSFEVAVLHRVDHSLPRVVPLGTKRLGRAQGKGWVAAPHLYLNGNLCVASPEDWDNESDTAATVVGWAAHWYACYTAWFVTGRWPLESYRADAA